MKLEKRHFLQIINSNRGIIRSLCSVYYVSCEDQKDAFQDIVLQLWKSFDTFRGKSEIRTWIYRVSINTILNKIRRNKKSVQAQSLEDHHNYISNAHADDNVELLHIALKSLKEIDRAIVVLYLEGYQNKEIAEMLKLSPTNVSTRFNRLKSELRMKFNYKSHAAKRS